MRVPLSYAVRNVSIALVRPTSARCLCPTARSFHGSRPLSKRPDNQTGPQHIPDQTTAKQKEPRKSSLRQVAVEAERSRAGKRPSRRRLADADIDTKKITAYCAAEQYNISHVARLLEFEGYKLDPHQTQLFPQVVHVQTPLFPEDTSLASPERFEEHGDIFVFPSGTLVAWNVPERLSLRLVEKILQQAATNPHDIESETLEYIERPDNATSTIRDERILLGTRRETLSTRASEIDSEDGESPEANIALAMIAFSSGLSRSAKLSVLENLFETYFQSTKSIPTDLAKGLISFKRRFVLSKTGELLNIRAQLNLYSELTDSLPDLLWESKSELGLEGYFDKVGSVLDVESRIETLNERMDYANEIATVLRESLSERHGWTLEWYIIVLIAVEFGLEVWRFVQETIDRGKENEVRRLLERLLETLESSR